MAKARLSTEVTEEDSEKAFKLLYFAMFKKKPKERMEVQRRRPRNASNAAILDEEMETEEPSNEPTSSRTVRQTRR
jgi:DNA replicative helicase MCM subunit Mcm2 (Cdc46/Mcm family)